jgi:hypothetical protein
MRTTEDRIAICGSNYDAKLDLSGFSHMMVFHLKGKDLIMITPSDFYNLMERLSLNKIETLNIRFQHNAFFMGVTSDEVIKWLNAWGVEYVDRRKYI